MKALLGTFNQEMAVAGAFSVVVKLSTSRSLFPALIGTVVSSNGIIGSPAHLEVALHEAAGEHGMEVGRGCGQHGAVSSHSHTSLHTLIAGVIVIIMSSLSL